jgi:hypothetical protein
MIPENLRDVLAMSALFIGLCMLGILAPSAHVRIMTPALSS